MRKYGLSLLAIAITFGCGGSSPRLLQSVVLSPTSTTAQGSAVQFTATGYFNDNPFTVKLTSANWGACYQNQRTTAVSVGVDGLAQCAPGASGTYTVWAWASRGGSSCGAAGSLPANPCGGAGQCQVTGTAQLTCP
jgi:hypothetical protein